MCETSGCCACSGCDNSGACEPVAEEKKEKKAKSKRVAKK